VERTELLRILGALSKKGYFEILSYVGQQGIKPVHYSSVLGYVMKNKVARSDATVTHALKFFTDYRLLKRIVSQDRPVRTTYELTRRGRELLRHLGELENLEP
jgi:DNA-binding HxlR family transcriptional regulator